MKPRLYALITAAAACAAVLQAQAPIKIGTIAPDNSPYVRVLREMCDAWKQRTNNRVTCAVFAGTTAEETMLRNLRGSARSLHAAQLSAISLSRLDNAFNVFGLPMFFESYEEADRVLEKLRPTFEQRLEREGLKALNFAYAGWVRLFSTEPVKTVADLKRLPLYTSTGDDQMAKWYRDNGFTPKQLDPTQLLEQLQTRGIQAAPGPPIFAHILNWYRSAPYMIDLGFAPLLGATVMSLDTWKRLGAEDQVIVLEEARRAGERLRKSIPAQEDAAIEEMKKRKLTVTTVDPVEWRHLADQLAQGMLAAKLIPQDVYDIARHERDAVRAGTSATR